MLHHLVRVVTTEAWKV